MLFCVFATLSLLARARIDAENTAFSKWDPQHCPQDIRPIDVLPGKGWDNLQNRPLGQILSLNFSRCRLSYDRAYMIPDNVDVSPSRVSQVDVYAETIKHWSQYQSTTSKGINVGAEMMFKPLGKISGSYSDDFQRNKLHYVNRKSFTTRLQLRHEIYDVAAEVNSPLHPVFKSRLLEIASHLQAGDLRTANFLSQLLVRDYGTHVITEVTAGAALIQEDRLLNSFSLGGGGIVSESTIAAAAGATFFGKLSIGGNTTHKTGISDTTLTYYLTNRTSSSFGVIGGAPFDYTKTVDEWRQTIPTNLAAINRNGEPMFSLVNRYNLPRLPATTIKDLQNCVQDAVKQYYIHNAHFGCLDSNSKHFDVRANIGPDNECAENKNNFTFGGIYQKCIGATCDGLTQVNPKTGNYTCPDGFQSVLLYSGARRACLRKCERSFLFFKHCYDDCTIVQDDQNTRYGIYWCSPISGVQQNSGYLFGGIYNYMNNNLLTKDQSCPENFYPLNFGPGTTICLSDDQELAKSSSVSFGGFFSCKSGNPLSINENKMLGVSAVPDLATYFRDNKASLWPKRCPSGFNQHLAAIVDSCEIMYCVKALTFVSETLPPLNRPPYSSMPSMINNGSLILFTRSQRILYKKNAGSDWEESSPERVGIIHQGSLASDDATTTVQPGVTAALTIACTCLIAVMVAAIVFGVRKFRRNSRQQPHHSLPNQHYRASEQTVSIE
ncbi:macrophage-expressed gene 1 protein-like [Tubulanus polymorphus]|uniref:macrophage-expressed gene 1 protein-like n=1 Tax=Tubulanus polymorphus TaxID=672921 RepID=UPI003DA46F10